MAGERAEIEALFAAHFRELLAAEFRYTNASGAVFDRAGYLAFYLESGRARWQSQEWDELDVQVHGEVAVATCRLRDRATFDGEALDVQFRTTQVFVRRDGAWRYLAGHTSAAEG